MKEIFNNLLWVLVLGLSISACNRPVSRFTTSSDEVSAPATIHFNNESKNADFYLWYFGDGDSSFLANPEHTYYKPGDYKVILQSIKEGKANTRHKKITITSPTFSMIEIQTKFGNMIVKLYDDTPEHKENFLELTREGFYNDLLFHRVIDGFMIQGGDPDSRDAPENKRLGSGGPGYQISSEIEAGHRHFKGALAAARKGDMVNPEKESSGSQFYIVHGTIPSEDDLKMFQRRNKLDYSDEEMEQYLEAGGTPFLDGQYTVFGQVIKGLEVIDKIAKSNTDNADRPAENIKMQIVEIK
ncbi:peptidylprolyl isomerase [Membranihabitans maritimus]|uniref:peptidylprolyl isomerase n=1 Tax=Membranihabitans maritimus TaxID=2904244 RepID=UPI001F022EE4|nr:peptidylprolyl isomerase [Membranihabitans maritimus]